MLFFGTFSNGCVNDIFTKSIIFQKAWQFSLSILLRDQMSTASNWKTGLLLYIFLSFKKSWFTVKNVTIWVNTIYVDKKPLGYFHCSQINGGEYDIAPN